MDVGEDAVLDAMDEALTASIVTEEAGAPGSFSFTHTLNPGGALYQHTPPAACGFTIESQAHSSSSHHRPSLALSNLLTTLDRQPYTRARTRLWSDAGRAGDRAASALAFEHAAHWYDDGVAGDGFRPPRNTDATRQATRVATSNADAASSRSGSRTAAKNAFEAAASLLSPAEHEQRAELLIRLAEAAFWLMDVAALRKFAGEAQVLADRAGRDDLWADAQAWMASAMVSDGDVPAAIHMDREAIARAGGIRSFGLARTPLTLYWAGLTDEAIQHGSQAVGTARASEDPRLPDVRAPAPWAQPVRRRSL